MSNSKCMDSKVMTELQDICRMKDTLMTWCNAEVSKGVDGANCKELGETIDMIKDLAEAKKSCLEACYYETVVTAMEEEGEDPERYGYNHYHTGSGRFASRGNGHYVGYNHNMKEGPYIDGYLHDPNFRQNMMGMYGYEDAVRNGGSSSRMGYHPTNDYGIKWDDRVYGYPNPETAMRQMDHRYGQAYNDYRMAKKHYTQTNSPEDKNQMEHKANEHMSDMINTMREIWKDADPTLRKRMTTDLTALLNEMK